jgi:hypothetical protein
VQNRHAEVYWSVGVWPCTMHAGMGVGPHVRIDRVLPPLGTQMCPAVAIHRCQRHYTLQGTIQCSCKASLAECSKPQATAEVSWSPRPGCLKVDIFLYFSRAAQRWKPSRLNAPN